MIDKQGKKRQERSECVNTETKCLQKKMTSSCPVVCKKCLEKYWARCMQEKIKETDKTKTSY